MKYETDKGKVALRIDDRVNTPDGKGTIKKIIIEMDLFDVLLDWRISDGYTPYKRHELKKI
jgi:hypothetical protein